MEILSYSVVAYLVGLVAALMCLLYSFIKPRTISSATLMEDAALSGTATGDVDIRVRKVIAESLCVDLEDVTLKASLINDLGAESIDFLDIMFRLEKEFDIKIPQREIERQARGGISEEEFEVDGIIQPKGIERMQALLPEIDKSAWKEGMALREMPALFTVAVFCGIVRRKLDGKLFSPDSASDTPEVPA